MAISECRPRQVFMLTRLEPMLVITIAPNTNKSLSHLWSSLQSMARAKLGGKAGDECKSHACV
eukprot:CAMPEP_0177437382 /NCGR_PEP_ID=MMETSP0369-20130122/2169_1 /TAXON_ID=447022 ORGANISM="Scrippsiella hangoei-like, Strain SHHI-4" /NCGR_SAMPLE_ID=MMETSP0369 /ASSEMBLY_ACC=CAM_ASM_000364 /LENGTH=62 /DNA_ID=CAMNT_0018908833 /DNA_START=207 /DNA_END=391 /DNA_ORIENTATION=+